MLFKLGSLCDFDSEAPECDVLAGGGVKKTIRYIVAPSSIATNTNTAA
jgi:hypothetical protein